VPHLVAFRAVSFQEYLIVFVQMFEIIGGVYTGICEISDPESCVAEDSSLLGQDAVSLHKYLPTFRINLAIFVAPTLKITAANSSETPVIIYNLTQTLLFKQLYTGCLFSSVSHRNEVSHRLAYSYILQYTFKYWIGASVANRLLHN
jgi:hypothetical protein